MTANDCGVGADGRTLAHHRPAVAVLAAYSTSGIHDICEHAARPEENIICANDSGIDRYVVLNLAVSPERDTRGNNHVLPDVAHFPDNRPLHNVGEVPDLCSVTDGTSLIYHRRRVSKILFFHTTNIIFYCYFWNI